MLNAISRSTVAFGMTAYSLVARNISQLMNCFNERLRPRSSWQSIRKPDRDAAVPIRQISGPAIGRHTAALHQEDITMDKARFDKGLEVRTAVLGKDYVEASMKNADDFNRPFQELVTE